MAIFDVDIYLLIGKDRKKSQNKATQPLNRVSKKMLFPRFKKYLNTSYKSTANHNHESPEIRGSPALYLRG